MKTSLVIAALAAALIAGSTASSQAIPAAPLGKSVQHNSSALVEKVLIRRGYRGFGVYRGYRHAGIYRGYRRVGLYRVYRRYGLYRGYRRYGYYGYSNIAVAVARAAEETRPREAIELYQQYAERLIALRERKNYQVACTYLVKVRALYEKLFSKKRERE